jgi:glycerophosphoryl diester phosphodiesterase
MSQMQIIAHRGNSTACHENTMPAFERAVADGADAIEFDVRLTKDNQWIVHHDAELADGSSRVRIRDTALSDIMRLRVGPNRDAIPRLDDFLIWAREQGIGLVFDIKDKVGIPELVATVERVGLSNPVIYSSFHRSVLKELEALRPNWLRGLIVGDPRSGFARRFLLNSIVRWSARHRMTSLHLDEHWVVPSALAKMREAGLRLAVWTVDDPLRIAMLAAFEIDAVITNSPDLACITLRGNQTH